MSEWIKKLHPTFKALWLEALRSGRYQQTRGQLRSSSGYCCLGVLCDISHKGTWLDTGSSWSYGLSFFDSSDQILPGVVAEACGSSNLPYVPVTPAMRSDPRCADRLDNREEISLSALNDYGYTFSEIADLIEEYL